MRKKKINKIPVNVKALPSPVLSSWTTDEEEEEEEDDEEIRYSSVSGPNAINYSFPFSCIRNLISSTCSSQTYRTTAIHLHHPLLLPIHLYTLYSSFSSSSFSSHTHTPEKEAFQGFSPCPLPKLRRHLWWNGGSRGGGWTNGFIVIWTKKRSITRKSFLAFCSSFFWLSSSSLLLLLLLHLDHILGFCFGHPKVIIIPQIHFSSILNLQLLLKRNYRKRKGKVDPRRCPLGNGPQMVTGGQKKNQMALITADNNNLQHFFNIAIRTLKQ